MMVGVMRRHIGKLRTKGFVVHLNRAEGVLVRKIQVRFVHGASGLTSYMLASEASASVFAACRQFLHGDFPRIKRFTFAEITVLSKLSVAVPCL
jgi:hypothetical protein